MYVVSVSGAYGATMLHGPFNTSAAAHKWAEVNVYSHFRYRVVAVVPTTGEYGTARPIVNIAPAPAPEPKHPEYHSTHSDVWDMREGK